MMRRFGWWLASAAMSLPGMIGNVLASPWRAMLRAAPIRLWAIIGAGVSQLAFTCGLVWIIRKDAPADHILGVYAILAYSAQFIVFVVVVALTGTVVRFSAGKEGLKADVAHDDDNAAPPAAVAASASGVAVGPASDVVTPVTPATAPPAE